MLVRLLLRRRMPNLPLVMPGLAIAAAPLRSSHMAAVNMLLVLVFGLSFVQFSHLSLFLFPGQYDLVANFVYPKEAERNALMPLLAIHCASAEPPHNHAQPFRLGFIDHSY